MIKSGNGSYLHIRWTLLIAIATAILTFAVTYGATGRQVEINSKDLLLLKSCVAENTQEIGKYDERFKSIDIQLQSISKSIDEIKEMVK